MARKEGLLLYTGVYSDVSTALADLRSIQDLHKDEMIGKYDAAVIDKQGGKPHIAKRVDRPRIEAIPEAFGGGTLPRKELKEAAMELTADQAGLIVVGEPTIEKGMEKAVTSAARIVKRTVDASTDEISNELKEALSS